MPKQNNKRKTSCSLLHHVYYSQRFIFLSLYPKGLLLARYAGLFIPMLPYESCPPISFQAKELYFLQKISHNLIFSMHDAYLIFLMHKTYLIFSMHKTYLIISMHGTQGTCLIFSMHIAQHISDIFNAQHISDISNAQHISDIFKAQHICDILCTPCIIYFQCTTHI